MKLPWRVRRGQRQEGGAGRPPLLFLPETAGEHVRNALALVRLALTTGEPVMSNEGPGVVVPVATLDAIQRRLACALERLDRR